MAKFAPIPTYGVKYIGSKQSLLPYIKSVIEPLDIKTALDVFTGTTRVAQLIRGMGIKTLTIDLSWASEGYANTFVHGQANPDIDKFLEEAMNVEPKDGWLTEYYSGINYERVMVWQPKNTRKADAIRDWIETLKVDCFTEAYLITSLIFGLDAVDNTVGVQQAYLKDWCIRSHNDLALRKFDIDYSLPIGKHLTRDVLRVKLPRADLVYIDPPYSNHNYMTYYHIWDSIYRWDKPDVGLTTNRRIDRVSKARKFSTEIQSPWNSKRYALSATRQLFERISSKHIVLSYNNEGIMDASDLIDLCSEFGDVRISRIQYKRHVMSKIGNAEKKEIKKLKNAEFLILITT